MDGNPILFNDALGDAPPGADQVKEKYDPNGNETIPSNATNIIRQTSGKSVIELNFPFFNLSLTIFDIASNPTALIPPRA